MCGPLNSQWCVFSDTQKCSSCTYKGRRDTFPLRKDASGLTSMCFKCTAKRMSVKKDKENMNPSKPTRKAAGSGPDLAGISLNDCIQLLLQNKDKSFDLDALVQLPDTFFEGKVSKGDKVNKWVNCVCDTLAEASEYHWK